MLNFVDNMSSPDTRKHKIHPQKSITRTKRGGSRPKAVASAHAPQDLSAELTQQLSAMLACEMKMQAVYVAKPEWVSLLCAELGAESQVVDNLIFSPITNTEVCFATDIWLTPQIKSFESISMAANMLREAGKYWYLHPLTYVRRSRLIEAQVHHHKPSAQHFPIHTPIPTPGVFCLLDKNTLLFATQRVKKWPDGLCHFIEDKVNPPNRAYLKLWEALTLLNKIPKAPERALDLGASPGGWTYVMQSLGVEVTAVDKAPLEPKIATRDKVHYLQQSAFALNPETLPTSFDWVLSDIACYPERAYALIQQWIHSGKAKQMIFTIKFQGKVTPETLAPFQNIPNGKLLHLFYNKNEATFFYPGF